MGKLDRYYAFAVYICKLMLRWQPRSLEENLQERKTVSHKVKTKSILSNLAAIERKKREKVAYPREREREREREEKEKEKEKRKRKRKRKN